MYEGVNHLACNDAIIVHGKLGLAGTEGVNQSQGARIRVPTFIITVLVLAFIGHHVVHSCTCVAAQNWLVVSYEFLKSDTLGTMRLISLSTRSCLRAPLYDSNYVRICYRPQGISHILTRGLVSRLQHDRGVITSPRRLGPLMCQQPCSLPPAQRRLHSASSSPEHETDNM